MHDKIHELREVLSASRWMLVLRARDEARAEVEQFRDALRPFVTAYREKIRRYEKHPARRNYDMVDDMPFSVDVRVRDLRRATKLVPEEDPAAEDGHACPR